jgi:lysine 2,3-aminomutase
LPLDTCPVYCRFCTRSYAIGLDTEEVEKVQLKANEERWKKAYQYISSRPELEDIVISGGDVYQLRRRSSFTPTSTTRRRSRASPKPR